MTNDIKIWKDLSANLGSVYEENKAVLQMAQKEIETELDKNKKEAYAKLKELQSQIEQFDELLNLLEQKDLFTEDNEQLIENLQLQKEKSQVLADHITSLLNEEGQEQEENTIKSRSSREKSMNYHPRNFKDSFLLGNWICYLPDNRFTCQSFWKDKTFKEYVFEHSKLIQEREGTYQLQPGKLILKDLHKTQVFTIQGFTDDSIEYDVDGRHFLFQYMPEELLNSFLQDPRNNRRKQNNQRKR